MSIVLRLLSVLKLQQNKMQPELYVHCMLLDSSMEWSSSSVAALLTSSEKTVMMPAKATSSRKRHRKPKLQYAKRRFSPVNPNDLVLVRQEPTHCVRLVFPLSKRWIHFDGLVYSLARLNVSMTVDYHVTLALIHAPEAGECFGNLLHLTPLLKDCLLEFKKLCILGKTLTILASEWPFFTDVKKNKDNLTVPKAVEWLKEHGYEIYSSQLPLHMSLAKLHDLPQAQFTEAAGLCHYFDPREFALPSALEVVKIGGGKVNGRSIPLVRFPINNEFKFIPYLYQCA
uniref:ORF4b n=1 Tax=Bat coronavirus HKU4 TaxID=694007 RepID=A0A6F8IM22_BCHK4|nr:ORF4b [Tylonycteris bat coronavirus HKU4]AWH65891.1 ORF4b [Tylonycteris bat coronavirus HKU4]